jgi:hypothetical protein
MLAGKPTGMANPQDAKRTMVKRARKRGTLAARLAAKR